MKLEKGQVYLVDDGTLTILEVENGTVKGLVEYESDNYQEEETFEEQELIETIQSLEMTLK